MTQTIRRKNCKTRQGWAERKVVTAATCPDGVNVVYAPTATKLLLAEHRRAVRTVKRAKALQFHGLRDTDTNEFLEGYEAACVAILAALAKGRA